MLRRLLVTTALLSTLFAIAPATASAAECWKELFNDYWADNRVDRQYPVACYRQAMSELPRDVQESSDAQDDLRRALLDAVRIKRLNEGFEEEFDEGDGAAAAAPVDGDDGGDKGFFQEVIERAWPEERRLDPGAPARARLDRAAPDRSGRRQLRNALLPGAPSGRPRPGSVVHRDPRGSVRLRSYPGPPRACGEPRPHS